MRESFDKAFEIVIGLEGKPTNDPNDPGGFTIFGLSKRFNPEVHEGTTLEEAKELYLERYWKPSGADHSLYPLDICLFDGAVNPQDDPDDPGKGNREILDKHPANWYEFLMLRMVRYMENSKPGFVKGHVFRVLRLYGKIKEDIRLKQEQMLKDGGY